MAFVNTIGNFVHDLWDDRVIEAGQLLSFQWLYVILIRNNIPARVVLPELQSPEGLASNVGQTL